MSEHDLQFAETTRGKDTEDKLAGLLTARISHIVSAVVPPSFLQNA